MNNIICYYEYIIFRKFCLAFIVIDSKDNEAHIKINTKIFQKGFEPKEFNQQRLSMPEEPIKEANSSNISWKPLKWDSNAVVFSPAKKNKNGKVRI